MDAAADSRDGRKPTVKQEISVTDLRRRLGERRHIDIDVLLPSLAVVASRSKPEPVTGELTIESIERGVSVTGTIEFEWEGECRRCLEPVAGRAVVPVLDIFQVNAPDDVEEISELVDNTIDLVPVVRDAVLLGLPLAPLCRDDCAGPDPDRYPTITEEENEAAERPPDPRWGPLAGLDLDD